MTDGAKIQVNGDELLTKHEAWAKGEASDASNAGTRREAIGAYAEKSQLENKALSQFRAGMKIKNDGKRKEWLRSLQILLPIAEREIFNNEEELPMDNPNAEKQQAAAAAMVADQSNEMAEELGVGEEAGEESLDEETAEFNQQVDDVVTPIEFNGAK